MRIGRSGLALAVTLALGAAACGSNTPSPPDDGPTTPDDTGTGSGAGNGGGSGNGTGNGTPPGGSPQAICQQVQVKLRGVRPGVVSEFTLRLRGLRASSGAALAAADDALRTANLAAMESGFLLGTLTPAGDGSVSASFEIASAHVTGSGFSGEVQGCAQVLLSFTRAQVKPGCQVTVDLDLGRSLQRDPVTGERFILPHHTVRF